jgi:hypothetical protein
VDGGCGDGGMAGRDNELVKVADHVASVVKSGYGGLLPLVDFEGSLIGASSTQRRSELRSYPAAKRRLQDVEADSGALLQPQAQPLADVLDCGRTATNPYFRIFKEAAVLIVHTWTIRGKDRDMARIRP